VADGGGRYTVKIVFASWTREACVSHLASADWMVHCQKSAESSSSWTYYFRGGASGPTPYSTTTNGGGGQWDTTVRSSGVGYRLCWLFSFLTAPYVSLEVCFSVVALSGRSTYNLPSLTSVGNVRSHLEQANVKVVSMALPRRHHRALAARPHGRSKHQ
jgi:hypothetical protein